MTSKETVKQLFDIGAHFAFSRTRRDPSTAQFIFGQKNKNDIFDLEKTAGKLDEATEAATEIASAGKNILFVAGKNEARAIVQKGAEKAEMPFVCGRWIGGTFTNFKEISKRVKRLETLRADKEKGNLDKYTKKERLLIDREIDDLEATFGGIAGMKDLPAAIFVVDPRHEHIAVSEAVASDIPIIALASSDCDLASIKFPIPANDATGKSIQFFTEQIVKAIEDGRKKVPAQKDGEESKDSE